jgi:D-glycero-alpha-D-manno-heptose-7-phosphate kinase
MVEHRRRGPRSYIITRTPLRISFVGGGTDLPSFYRRAGGAVLSMAIDRYVYVTVKRHSELFFEPIRINYSKSEQVDRIDEVKNNIVRESMRFLDIEPPIYISTVGDVPASTGLGGSSAFAVGLLHALHAYRGDHVSAGRLAEEASTIEIDVLGEPIGKQDQYAAAFGGLNLFQFKPDGGVTVQHQQAPNGTLGELFESILLFWTGHQRDASSVLVEQRSNIEAKQMQLGRMRDQASELHDALKRGAIDVVGLGRMLDEGWRLKRQLARRITNVQIDHWYEAAIAAGAAGGKLCGAGNGGFLLFIVPPARHAAVRAALADLTEMRVGPDLRGSQLMIPFNG